MRIFVKYSAFHALFFFVCAAASASEIYSSDDLYDGPPKKKIKLDSKKMLSAVADESRDDWFVQKIKDSGTAGCYFADLNPLLRPSRSGKTAVLEYVVNIMFKRQIDIFYDRSQGRYWYRGEATQTEGSLMDVRVFTAQSMMSLKKNGDFCAADIGYNVFQAGYRLTSYGIFYKIYEAVRTICSDDSKEKGPHAVNDFLRFLKKQTSDKPSVLPVWYKKYEDHSKRKISDWERKITNYIFSLNKDVLQKMIDVTEGSSQQTLSWLLAQKFVLLHVSDGASSHPLSPSEGSAQDSRHVAFVVVEYMKEHSIANVGAIVKNKRLIEYAGGEEKLKTVAAAVRILCYRGVCTYRRSVLRFVNYAKKKLKEREMPFAELREAYKRENTERNVFDKWWGASEYILYLPEDVFEKLQDMSIPVASREAEVVSRHERIKPFIARMKECARAGWQGPYTKFLSFLPKNKGYFYILNKMLPLIFAYDFVADFTVDGHISLSTRETERSEPFVPMEVIIAGRLDGRACTATEKIIFANTIYQLGYPIKDVEEFFEVFDAVCVARNIPINNRDVISRSSTFLRFIQNCKEQKNLEGYKASYPFGDAIKVKEMILTEHALEFNKGEFVSWRLPCVSRDGLSIAEGHEERIELIVQTLQKYAQHKKECPYRIIDAFLYCEGSAEKVLAEVMDVVLRNNLNMTYNCEKKTYILHDGPNMRVKGARSLWDDFSEKTCLDQKMFIGEVAYRLYDAGYHFRSCADVSDLQKVRRLLSFPNAKDTLSQCKDFVFYVLTNITQYHGEAGEGYRAFQQAGGQALRLDAWCFGESLLRLYFREIITIGNVHSCFNTEPGETEDSEQMDVEQAGCSQVTACSQVTDEDFKSFVQDGMYAQTTFRYAEIMPYAKGVKTPEAVLEFVMDFVFKQGCCVQYDKDKEAYKFLTQTYEKGQHKREEMLMRYMKQTYADQGCTVRDRAECAYEAHVRGASYSSFEDFCQDFGAVCMVHNISVKGMEEIARCQRYWEDMKEVASSRDMFQRALSMAVLM